MGATLLVDPATIAQLEAEERDFEVIDGEVHEIMSAAAKHNFLGMALAGPLYQAVTASGWGKVVYEIYFQFGDQRVRPDLALLSRSTLDSADPDRVPMRAIPEIVVEIVSPSDIVYRLDRKIAVYLEAGVKEVWVLYPDLRHVLIHTGSAIRDLRGSDELTAPVLPGWSLPVERLFA